jgi:hypothetical protein
MLTIEKKTLGDYLKYAQGSEVTLISLGFSHSMLYSDIHQEFYSSQELPPRRSITTVMIFCYKKPTLERKSDHYET